MKQSKKFTCIFLIAITAFLSFHLIVWHILGTKKLLSPKEGHRVGDVSRISYCSSCTDTRKLDSKDLPKQHKYYDSTLNQKADVLTFGDSYSIGRGCGLNPYYQDYIASCNNFNVLHVNNIGKGDFEPVNTLVNFINSGELDKIKPRYIVLQSSGKHFIERLSSDIDFDASMGKEEFYDFYKGAKHSELNIPKAKFLNSGNYKAFFYNLFYNFNQRAFFATAYRLKTNKKIHGHDFVLVHKAEIKALRHINEESIIKANENLNKLNSILAKRGIKLYVLISPDKYDVYYDYLTNGYGENKLFELLRPLKKEYNFIDSQAILRRELANGCDDIYLYDDTHWSYKASEAIFKEVTFD